MPARPAPGIDFSSLGLSPRLIPTYLSAANNNTLVGAGQAARGQLMSNGVHHSSIV